jgi:hypothetical protein
MDKHCRLSDIWQDFEDAQDLIEIGTETPDINILLKG